MLLSMSQSTVPCLHVQNRSFENNVLINKEGTRYFLPCYPRLKLKSLLEIDIENQTALMRGTLFLNVYYGGLEKYADRLLCLSGLVGGSETILFEASANCTVKKIQQRKKIAYIYRGKFRMKLRGSVFLTPFETLTLKLVVTLNTKTFYDKQQGVLVNLKFNCMNTTNLEDKFSFDDIDESVATYGIVNDSFQFYPSDCAETAEEKQEIAEVKKHEADISHSMSSSNTSNLSNSLADRKLKEYHHIIFEMAIFRYPLTSMLDIYIPVWILATINLCTFYAANSLADRLQDISGTMIAFLAFLPSIRSRMPETASLTLMDASVYLLIFTTVLILVQSVIIRDVDDYTFTWNKDYFFLATVAIVVCTFAIQMLLLAHYRLSRYPKYMHSSQTGIYYDWEERADECWSNPLCAATFNPITCHKVQKVQIEKTEITDLKRVDSLEQEESEIIEA